MKPNEWAGYTIPSRSIELRRHFPLPGLLKLAGIARSTFYYQQKAAQAHDKHAGLKKQIVDIYARHKGRYGYRRITAAIRQLGKTVNHKTVQGLMTKLGLKWVTDVTEFKVSGEKLYLSPVMDLYNGEIIAFETSKRPEFALVGTMLKKALKKLKPGENPILHSDQGWQYRMPAYQRALREKSVVQSMSRKGNCLDNAAMESFFAVLKSEFFHLNKFSSVDELQNRLKNYIHYYNHERIKLKLKGLSPVQYRTQPLAAH